jgi:hypothetical protein
MINFDIAKKAALNALLKGNPVTKLSEEDKKLLPFLSKKSVEDYDVLLIEKEFINTAGIGEDISLYMVLTPQFPLDLPKIYLPEKEYDRIKYIPHVDINRFICTFDPDTTRTNPNLPEGIVIKCLSKAINIIERGLSTSNHSDFEDEFKAYWENKYDDESVVKEDILALIDTPEDIKQLHYIKLKKSISIYNHVIYQDDENGTRFLDYLKYKNILFYKESICYLGLLNIPFQPPFLLDNEKVDELISSLDSKQKSDFTKYINSSGQSKLIIGYVPIKGSPLFIGWIHSKFDLKRKGFRTRTLTNYYVFKHFQKNDKVLRVSPKIFTPTQSIKRTDGLTSKANDEYKFLIAGLGSIGSNLLYFLNTLNNPQIKLVDFDKLNIDNINRHFLGMNHLGFFKTESLKAHFKLKNPFQIVTCKNESIIKTCQTDLSYINNADFIFCAIGKANIDQWIGNALKDGIIIKPTFFLWVEPYLIGGHCLFLTPKGKTYETFFDANNFYNNNIIDNNEYLIGNPNLMMREIGCQTSYTPYSINNLTFFLSSIFGEIRKIINNPPTESISITWQGDLQILNDLNIRTSNFAKDHLNEQIIVMK